VIFKSDKLDYHQGPRKEKKFDDIFSIGQGPSNIGKLNWNLLGFSSFIFSLGQCEHLMFPGTLCSLTPFASQHILLAGTLCFSAPVPPWNPFCSSTPFPPWNSLLLNTLCYVLGIHLTMI
jgi:hypothetical protein